MITPENLMKVAGKSDIIKMTEAAKAINDTMAKYEINTPLRQAHFLAQIFHESGKLRFVKENLNYSAKGLRAVFGKYFPNNTLAEAYARKQEMIGDRVYANRMGNGDENSGDGSKFRGRGYIQITGCDNYTSLSKDLGIDFIKNPELLETVKYAALSAGWFWNKNNLNALADKDDVLKVTKRINGGTHGLADRTSLLAKFKDLLK